MAFIDHLTGTRTFILGPLDVLKVVRKKWHRRQKHNEIAQLLDKPNWVLNDMGITRGDVREALAFRGDSSLHLRALAARRRFWSRPIERV